jgi:hypothetical protein
MFNEIKCLESSAKTFVDFLKRRAVYSVDGHYLGSLEYLYRRICSEHPEFLTIESVIKELCNVLERLGADDCDIVKLEEHESSFVCKKCRSVIMDGLGICPKCKFCLTNDCIECGRKIPLGSLACAVCDGDECDDDCCNP